MCGERWRQGVLRGHTEGEKLQGGLWRKAGEIMGRWGDAVDELRCKRWALLMQKGKQ